MKLLRLRAVDDYDEEILPAGHHYIRCALDEVLLFLRPGHIVPVAQPANNTSELDDASLTLWSFLPDGESAEYRMYRDDGVTTEYEKKEHWKTLQIHHSRSKCPGKAGSLLRGILYFTENCIII